MTKSISFYPKPWEIESEESIPLDIFLDNIRNGKWQDITLKIRTEKDEKKQEALKKKAPSVTLSGLFQKREDDKIKEHSGYIGIDIDADGFPENITDPEELKSLVCTDKYVCAAFVSIRGGGLCLIFKINPAKHREAFYGISEYLFNAYGIVVDPTSVNPSRARFVSWDPHIFISDTAEKFAQYPKTKTPKKIEKVVYAADDFANILNQIVAGQINITQDSYHVWLRIAFAIVHKFGDSGRQAFHTISQYSMKYEFNVADKQYNACLRHHAHTPTLTTISTLYYYAKEAGLQVYSERTRKIAYTASQSKKTGLNAEQITQNLAKFEDITGPDVVDIVKQVINGNIIINEDTVIDQLELWMRQNYTMKRNEITRYIECNDKILEQKDFNSIFIKAKKIFDAKISFELIDRLINSDFVPGFNPLLQWFHANLPEYQPEPGHQLKTPCIDRLFESVKTKDPEYLLYFGKKWLVGVISAVHGEHSPLVLALCGEKQNTGKTEFFRRILPIDLLSYYAESKLDKGTDDEILMCKKLIILDDEGGSKSRKEAAHFKRITSANIFTLREPYGRHNVDLKRLAVLCITSNEPSSMLSDPTGNRRIIPVYVDDIDKDLYNSINKTELWLEAYRLYKSGFQWKLNHLDIAYLSKDTEIFEVVNSENELILKYFEPNGPYEVTCSDIKIYIEKHTNQRLSLDRIGKELKRLNFEQRIARIGNTTRRVYMVNYTLGFNAQPLAPVHPGAIAPLLGPVQPWNEISDHDESDPGNGGGFVPYHDATDRPF